MKKLIKAFICACVLAGLLASGGFDCAEAGSGELSIHVFSFGKADSYLFMTGEAAALIDSTIGTWEYSLGSGNGRDCI